jgi:hypothetical protein
MDLYSEIALLKGHEHVPLQALFGQVNLRHETICDVCVGSIMSIRKQTLFTHSIQTYINKHYPDLLFTVEENFLQTRYEKIQLGSSRGPRVDILFESIKVVIEFDEKHHENYEQSMADDRREEAVNC